MEIILMDTENSKRITPQKFVLNMSQRLALRRLNKHVALQNLFIYYTWKHIRKQYKNNKLKINVLTQNDEFELPDGSSFALDIQDYIESITKLKSALGQFDPAPMAFRKNVSSKVRVKSWFFVTFNIIVSHIFPENLIKNSSSCSEDRKNLSVNIGYFHNYLYYLTFCCYKETNDVSIL